MMLFEPMKRSYEPKTLWHIGQESSPWSHNKIERGMPLPIVIPAPNCKTPHITAAVGVTVTPYTAERQPPYMNLTGSRYWQDDHATSPSTPLVGGTPRWRK
jgi:hypothetical protein